MGFKSDIEIAQECTMEPITKIAEKAGIDDKYLEQYGKYKAKIDYNLLKETDKKRRQTDSCDSYQPDTGRGRKNNYNGRSCRWNAETWKKCYGSSS